MQRQPDAADVEDRLAWIFGSSRSGRLSLYNGAWTGWPSTLVRPYALLITDGVRAANSSVPNSPRSLGTSIAE